MKVEIGKKYRLKSGEIYKLYTINDSGIYPVHGAYKDNGDFVPISHTLDGIYDIDNINSNQNLVEVQPYDDFKIDDKVIVTSKIFPYKEYRRYFAGVNNNGRPLTFRDGVTSWSKDAEWLDEWGSCRKWEGE